VDIAWFKPNGEVMSDQDWVSRHARALGVYLNGRAIPGQTDQGRPIADDSFRLLFNGHRRAVNWQPAPDFGAQWKLVLDTDVLKFQSDPHPVEGRVMTRARTVVVLEATEPG
jgi:glycogen operon protein